MKRFLLAVLVFLPLCLSAAGYSPASVPNPKEADARAFVADPDAILSDSARWQLNERCASISNNLDVEIAVVAISEMDGSDAYDFALTLFNNWGVGKKGKNTGVLILLVTSSRDIQIITGGGMEGLLPDAVCEEIIDQDMVPYLQNEQWDSGLLAGVQAMQQRLSTDDAKAELLLDYTPKEATLVDIICYYLIIACLILILLACVLYREGDWGPLTDDKMKAAHLSTWDLCAMAAIVFPLPVAFLAYWLYRHGGKEVQAYDSACRAAAREEAARQQQNHRGGKGGIFFGGWGGGGSSFGGGSFGGGMSFGGGAGHKF